jgi:muconolactone delta-isomerase
MKTSLALVLFTMALWLPNAMAAAPTRKLKGAKGARKARDLQEQGSPDHEHKEKKMKIDGPTSRSCNYSVKKRELLLLLLL